MSYIRPQDQVTLSLSDQDLRDLVADALSGNYLQTGGYNAPFRIDVSDLAANTTGGWEITYSVDEVKKEE